MKIVLSAVLALFLIGCGDDAKKEEVVKKDAPKEVVKKEEVKKVATKEVVQKVTGKSLFQTCAGCHGQDASKHAMGKSQIIKGWSADKITAALKGYQNGTYGGDMKAVMAGQANKLNAVDIFLVSKYISELK